MNYNNITSIKDNESIVYRHIEQLKLRSEIEGLAKKLMDQIDMPVVFEINYQGDKNYGRRHPVHHNQFWIQILPQEEQSEFERLVLYLLYMGLLERRRVVTPMILDEYRAILENIEDCRERESRMNNCKKTLEGLGSFAFSMEAHIYLKQYGIETSDKVKLRKFQHIHKTLKEYLRLQKTQPGFCWYDETALNNIIDMARTCWMNREHHNRIWRVMRQIKPEEKAEEYISRLNRLTEMLHLVEKEYAENPKMEMTSVIVERSFKILNLEKMAYLKKDSFMRRQCSNHNGIKTMRCAFVPEEIPRKEELIRGLRYLNTGLLLIQEYYRYECNINVPDPHVSLIITEDIQGYAEGDKEKGYHLFITIGLILKLYDASQTADIKNLELESCLLLINEKEIRERLYRYSLFYVITHEYIHVLHGDCDKRAENEEEKREREENADIGARHLVSKQLHAQYRPLSNDVILEQQRMMKNYACDQLIFLAAYRWCDELTGKI